MSVRAILRIIGVLFFLAAVASSIYLAQFFLKTPQDIRKDAAGNAIGLPRYNRDLPVVVIQYFPPKPGQPEYIDSTIAGPELQGQKIADIRARINGYTQQILSDLTNATKYQGYAYSDRQPTLRYTQYGNPYDYVEALPQGLSLNPTAGTYRPDYKAILNKINICDLVDNKGVKQVWLWGYHHGKIEPVESNMSMGRRSKAFFTHGTYGDISNSERTDDLPQCENTYILSNYNYTRGVGEALEDHGHHMESILNWFDGRDFLAGNRWPELLFWGKFVGSDTTHTVPNPGCGWIHTPPNGIEEYGWYRTTAVQSDCRNWNPQRTGAKTAISCTTWSGSATCPNDGGRTYKIWWFQNIPGEEANFTFAGRKLRNWWDLIYDFDSAVQEGGGLFVSQETRFVVTRSLSGAVDIEMIPAPPPYHQLKLYNDEAHVSSAVRYILPDCIDGKCYYKFTPTERWTRWRIGEDTLVPQNTPQTAITINDASMVFDTNEGYRSWIKFGTASTPTPTPTPSGKPDLTVETFNVNKTEMNVSEEVTISTQIKNIGTATTSGFKTSILIERLSESSAGSSSQLVETKSFTYTLPLNPGQKVEYAATINTLSIAGNYRVTVQTDTDNTLLELSETNNTSAPHALAVKDPNAATPTPTPTPTPQAYPQGDLDRDNDVDIFDYNILLEKFGESGNDGFTPADIIPSGLVDIFDFNALIQNFGAGS